MRSGTYYVIAGVLLFSTIPMYRYIFQRSRELSSGRPEVVFRLPPLKLAPLRTSARPRHVLLSGEECHGGFVFIVQGSSYTQAVTVDGHSARCESGYYLTP